MFPVKLEECPGYHALELNAYLSTGLYVMATGTLITNSASAEISGLLSLSDDIEDYFNSKEASVAEGTAPN